MSEYDFSDPTALALERERRRRRAEYSRELAAFTLEKWNLARNEAERKERERRKRRAEGKPSKAKSSRQAVLGLPPGHHHHRQYGTANPSMPINPVQPLLPLSNNATLARDQESPPTSPLQFQSRRERERERERRKRVSGTREDIVAMLREAALQDECESESPGSDGSVLSIQRAVIMKAGERTLRTGHKSPRHLTPAKEVAIVLG